ncbi:MAG: metallophosphoesterase [Deltaproteobacteria bacterium]
MKTPQVQPETKEASPPTCLLLAHISDLHMMGQKDFRIRSLLSKRILGYLSWRFKRGKHHQVRVLDALLEDLRQIRPNHVAITGDLTHLGTPGECVKARAWLERLGRPHDVTVIPGNHDTYVKEPWERTLIHWAPFMTDNGTHGPSAFPFLRVRGPVAIIGLSSARPTPPFLATGYLGRSQLERLATLLVETGRQGLMRVILIHHPPVPGSITWRKRLVDGQEFCHVIRRHGAELVLHGHAHIPLFREIDAHGKRIPVIGVPSASCILPGRGEMARYHLFNIRKKAGGCEVLLVIRGYDPSLNRFLDMEKKAMVIPFS